MLREKKENKLSDVMREAVSSTNCGPYDTNILIWANKVATMEATIKSVEESYATLETKYNRLLTE